MDAHGQPDSELTPDGFGGPSAAVSPDGTRVAYLPVGTPCSSDCTFTASVLTIDTDRASVVEIPIPRGFGGLEPLWSPDGERILFVSADGVSSVSVAPNSAPIVYSTGELNVEWSASEVTWQPVFP